MRRSKAISARMQCNEVSSRECKKLNANVQTLTTSANDQQRQVSIKSVSVDRQVAEIDETATVSTDQMARFSSLLDQAYFLVDSYGIDA